MKYYQLLKENHSACSSKNVCIDRFQTQTKVLTKIPSPLPISPNRKLASISRFISCKNDKFSGDFFSCALLKGSNEYPQSIM